MDRKFSPRAVWIASDDPTDGPVLLALAKEHVHLAKELIVNRDQYTVQDRLKLAQLLADCRQQQDEIIAKYEQRLEEGD